MQNIKITLTVKKKFFEIIKVYILPALLFLTSLTIIIQKSVNNSLDWISVTGFGASSFLGLFLLLESYYLKTASNISSDTVIPDSKDNRNLDETPPQESFNSVDGSIAYNINRLTDICYNASKAGGWHTDRHTGQLLDRNRAEMLCLIHSEISEAMEGERKGLMDDHLPNRPMAEVELADAVIRIGDYCGRWGYDLGGAIVEKLAYNATRADHKMENRNKEGGKKF